MSSLWNPSRGWVIREIMDTHELREQVQAMTLDQLQRFAEVNHGPPDSRKRGEACRRELAWRRGGDTPFR